MMPRHNNRATADFRGPAQVGELSRAERIMDEIREKAGAPTVDNLSACACTSASS